MENEVKTFNVLILGEGNVGKSYLLNTVRKGKLFIKALPMANNILFSTNKGEFILSFNRDFLSKEEAGKTKVDGALIFFDVSKSDILPLDEVSEWCFSVQNNTPTILVGNKYDLIQDELTKKQLSGFIPTSAKTGFNVFEPFLQLIRCINKDYEIQFKEFEKVS